MVDIQITSTSFTSKSSRFLLFVALLCIDSIRLTNGDGVKIDGWTEIKDGWPMGHKDYFVATEKGHHFIEVKLPRKLDSDLLVGLNYYYSYARVQPVLQMTPCKTNIHLVHDKSSDTNNMWQYHSKRVLKVNCAKRNELAYNVLLHDAGDIFAWKVMNISSIKPETTSVDSAAVDEVVNEVEESEQESSTSSPKPIVNTDRAVSDQEQGPQGGGSLEGLGGTAPTEQNTQSSNTDRIDTAEDFTTNRPEVPTKLTTTITDTTTQSTTTEKTLEQTSTPAWSDIDLVDHAAYNTMTESERGPQTVADVNDEATVEPSPATANRRAEGPVDKSDRKKTRQNDDKSYASEDDGADRPYLQKYKRSLNENDNLRQYTESCRPSSCDRHLFKMARFMPIVKGLPQLPTGVRIGKEGSKFLFNTNGRDLRIKLISNEQQLSEVDSCLKLQLFMDQDAELDFLLEDAGQQGGFRLLETIKKRIRDPTAGVWDSFKRCISDYIPRYVPPVNSLDSEMQLVLRPKSQADKQVAVLSSEESYSLSELYPTVSFLPDIIGLPDEKSTLKYWMLDKGGVREPSLKFERHVPSESSSKNVIATKIVRVQGIDLKQEAFDLTSRWLKVRDAELIEDPLLFVYKTTKADWIRSIELQFQRSTDSPNNWISRTFFTAPLSLGGPINTSLSADKMEPLELPIDLEGLDSKEFRLRIRHHLKQFASRTIGSLDSFKDGDLVIKSLAFADVCSVARYCENGGNCRPTGPVAATCYCPPGYSGNHCAHVEPCEVLYGNMTGNEICQSVGARCVRNLPVMRCSWPNDKYYHCRALYKENSTTTGPKRDDGGVSRSLPVQDEDQVVRLKETVNQQAKLIIILGAFLAAIMLFSVVLIGSMVSRLHKLKRRLERSENAHELSKRNQPASGGPRTATGRSGKANVMSYNNSAFDVDA